MTSSVPNDPILTRLHVELRAMYGAQIDRVILFGSRARGDAEPTSDYDVAVFLNQLPDRWHELKRLADLRMKLIDDTGAFIDMLAYPATAYAERSPLMREIRADGQTL